MPRFIIYLSIAVFGTVGAWLGAMVDGGNWFGVWSIIGTAIGSFFGIWAGYKLNQNF
jgi:hypothetical protein